MLLPFDWLKEFVEIKQTAEKIAERLVLSGTKVEEIKKSNGKVVLDLEITPNRGDQFSVLGVAREIAALLGKKLSLPPTDVLMVPRAGEKVVLKVKQKELCPGYTSAKLTNVEIKPSSKWIQEYLTLAGIRPINNIVDVTNLIMLEFGQPMHAFDKSKIKGALTLRASKAGDSLETLDGRERSLPEKSIVIEDEEKIIDLAGLMGGRNSEIDQKTQEVLLLVPIYNPVAIRRTSVAVGLRTEASSRFEKGLDPNLHPLVASRAIRLLNEEAGALLKSQIYSTGYPVRERGLIFDTRLVTKILGIDLNQTEIINLLSPLGFQCRVSVVDEDKLDIKIPSWRNDVAIEEDILEEIGRSWGYNRFPKTLPKGQLPAQPELFTVDTETILRKIMLSGGFNETTGYSLVSEQDILKTGHNLADSLRVLHPTSQDFSYLRPTLSISLIKAFGVNAPQKDLNFFEIAKTFEKAVDSRTSLPKQSLQLAFASTESYWALKAGLDAILTAYGLETKLKKGDGLKELKEGLEVLGPRGQVLAALGQVQPNIVQAFGLEQEVWLAQLNCSELDDLEPKIKYSPLPKYPAVKEDISFFVDKEILADEVIFQLSKLDPLIYQVSVSEALILNGRKSLTLHLDYLDKQKTLTEKEVGKVRDRVNKFIKKKFGAEIRG